MRSTDGGTGPTPLPLESRGRVAPRFLVPKIGFRKARQDLRPILQYTQILDSLSNNTWKRLRLCDPNATGHKSQHQVPDFEVGTVEAFADDDSFLDQGKYNEKGMKVELYRLLKPQTLSV